MLNYARDDIPGNCSRVASCFNARENTIDDVTNRSGISPGILLEEKSFPELVKEPVYTGKRFQQTRIIL